MEPLRNCGIGAPIRREEVTHGAEVPPCGKHLRRLHTQVTTELSLSISKLGALYLQLPFRHADAPLLPAVEIQRQRDADHDVVVRAERLLTTEIEHRIWPKPGLLHPCCGGVDVELCRFEIGVPIDGMPDQCVHCHIADGCLSACGSGPEHDCHDEYGDVDPHG